MNPSIATKQRQSFVNVPKESDFPLENLPYGVAKRKNSPTEVSVVVAIGDQAIDLRYLLENRLIAINGLHGDNPFQSASLNRFAKMGKPVWSSVRQQLIELLGIDNPKLRDNHDHRAKAIFPQSDLEMLLPFEIKGYTDFYASESHATNVGKLFRGAEQALMPNWRHVPIAYNGRAGTVIPSGTNFHRPWGQIKSPANENPEFETSKKMDFEVEIGFFVGKENELGEPISLSNASDHIFGLVLLNDWSARDIQAWEYQPLGPFLGKSFATTISPWVVPYEAIQGARLAKQNSTVVNELPYLKAQPQFLYDITITAELKTNQPKSAKTICTTNSKYLNWSFEQMLVHHASNGCKMNIGDLLGSGTISGTTPDSWGSLLEMTFNGKEKIQLGEAERSFLEDTDEVVLRGFIQTGTIRIGFGECTGKILPAIDIRKILGN